MRNAVKLLTVMSGAAAPLVPFTDSFDRANGDLGNGWTYTAGKWTIATNAAVGTPGLGSNLFVNPGFDTDANWTKEADWTIDAGDSNVATKAAGATTRALYQAVATAKKWYRYDWTVTAISAGYFNPRILHITNSPSRSTAATFIDTGRATATTAGFDGVAAAAGSIDNVSLKEITLADMFCTRDFGQADIDISVPLTGTDHAHGGIVVGLNSTTAPTYFVIAYHNGARVMVEKCVNGTYAAALVSVISTYGAGKVLRLKKVGAVLQVFYDGAQVGTDQTLTSGADDTIINATIHGMFSTDGMISFGSFAATNPT